MAPGGEAVAEAPLIVDLAVEDHADGVVIVGDGLSSGFLTDNAETLGGESDWRIGLDSIFIGP